MAKCVAAAATVVFASEICEVFRTARIVADDGFGVMLYGMSVTCIKRNVHTSMVRNMRGWIFSTGEPVQLNTQPSDACEMFVSRAWGFATFTLARNTHPGITTWPKEPGIKFGAPQIVFLTMTFRKMGIANIPSSDLSSEAL